MTPAPNRPSAPSAIASSHSTITRMARSTAQASARGTGPASRSVSSMPSGVATRRAVSSMASRAHECGFTSASTCVWRRLISPFGCHQLLTVLRPFSFARCSARSASSSTAWGVTGPLAVVRDAYADGDRQGLAALPAAGPPAAPGILRPLRRAQGEQVGLDVIAQSLQAGQRVGRVGCAAGPPRTPLRRSGTRCRGPRRAGSCAATIFSAWSPSSEPRVALKSPNRSISTIASAYLRGSASSRSSSACRFGNPVCRSRKATRNASCSTAIVTMSPAARKKMEDV